MSEWKLVPVNPTAGMIDAAYETVKTQGELFSREAYRAMLDAAPAAPQQAEPGRREDMADFAAKLKADPAKAQAFFQAAGIITAEGKLTPEYGGQSMTDAQMEAATVSDEASQERAAIAYKRGYEEALNDCIRNGGEEWARSMFANNGEHIKPQQVEPVGCFLFNAEWNVWEQMAAKFQNDSDAVQLYRHPPADEVQRLREAAYNAIKAFDQGLHGADEIDALRRALEGK